MSDLPAHLRRPAAVRLDPDHPWYAEILRAHEAALERADPGYLDPATGYFVFTAATLWDRGRCCATGCRHCPYVARDGRD